MEETLIDKTIALCPECLAPLPATISADGEGVVWMERTCEEHGRTRTRIWPDAEHYRWLQSLALPKTPPRANCAVSAPCPLGCGTCARHERRGTLLEIEVTRACNLHCPVCFMSAEDPTGDPSLEEIAAMYEVIADAVGTDGAVQLTGVYLSFDGTTGDVYEATCGRDILDVKLAAIERCREAGIQVVLSVAVLSGVNDGQLGDLLRFSLENADVVAGLALQPAFTSGRFEADREGALTAGDVIFKMAEQSEGLIEARDFWPLGCSNPLCDTGLFLVRDQRGADERYHPWGFYPATKVLTFDEYREAYNPDSPQGSVIPDILASRGVPVADGLSVIIMNYMDANTMDIQRMRECSMMVTVPDGRAIPFCSYHLTDGAGRRVYAPWCKEELRNR